MKSIIDNTDYCYICKTFKSRYVQASDTHHCISGTANRKLADEDGLTVRLCRRCHDRLHSNGEYKKELQIIAEQKWLEYYDKIVEDFIDRYGKNFLYDL